MKVIIAHQTVAVHDAIGNDIEQMYFILREKYECYVYAINRFNKKLQYINKEQVDKVLQYEDNVLIYHHSVFWEAGMELLKETKGKIVIRYHNVTPAIFFEGYSAVHYEQCKKGQEQTKQLISMFPEAVWLSDSKYNEVDLKGVPIYKKVICPPLNKLSEWDRIIPDENVLEKLIKSETIQLLFVGRIAPNKGHKFLINVLRTFRANYSKKIKLNIIGKFDSELKRYNSEIYDEIATYKLERNVEFIGEMTDEKMAAYYLGCDFFICASEHEGFCVPILEAQYFGLPIIALNKCAVPDTGGKGQVLLDSNEKLFAAAISVLSENRKYYDYIQKKGFDNIEVNMSYEQIRHIFIDFCENEIGLNDRCE